MSDQDHYHQYRWAIQKLEEAFGAGSVTPRRPGDRGEVLSAEVRNPAAQGEREHYLVLFKDHLLHDLNKHSNPGIFLQGEIQRARGYFEGKQPQGMTQI